MSRFSVPFGIVVTKVFSSNCKVAVPEVESQVNGIALMIHSPSASLLNWQGEAVQGSQKNSA